MLARQALSGSLAARTRLAAGPHNTAAARNGPAMLAQRAKTRAYRTIPPRHMRMDNVAQSNHRSSRRLKLARLRRIKALDGKRQINGLRLGDGDAAIKSFESMRKDRVG